VSSARKSAAFRPISARSGVHAGAKVPRADQPVAIKAAIRKIAAFARLDRPQALLPWLLASTVGDG
jgi:hypothetical protein